MVLCYGPVLSARCPSCCLITEGAKRQNNSLGSQLSLCIMNAIALPGAVTLVGELRAPRYQGPLGRLSREAGRPMGPSTPRCSSQSCAVFVVWDLVRLLELCLGNVERFVALGLLSCFGCPLSFWPRSFICPVLVRGISVF